MKGLGFHGRMEAGRESYLKKKNSMRVMTVREGEGKISREEGTQTKIKGWRNGSDNWANGRTTNAA